MQGQKSKQCHNGKILLVKKDDGRKQELLDAIKNGSIVIWRHINLHGEYDFSDERLHDSVGLKVPKILELKVV